MNLILGGGLAGVAASYHLGHENCLVLERRGYAYGHIACEKRDGYTWDEGPHISFTKHDYIKDLFERSVGGDYQDLVVKSANYYYGTWIHHPAQCNLYQVPEPIRSRCLESFLARPAEVTRPDYKPANYQEWLEAAFGKEFTRTFPEIYTRKYWTIPPRELTTDWIGERVYFPKEEEVRAGAVAPLPRETHYITHARYPSHGGYQSFGQLMMAGAQMRYGCDVERIDLKGKKVWLASGECLPYDQLINTLPLPVFISRCAQATPAVLDAAQALQCSQLLLVNATAEHPTLLKEHWFYVYDQDKLATRINCTETLSPFNAPAGRTGVQAEVYFSRARPLTESPDVIGQRVVKELITMGFLSPERAGGKALKFHTRWAPWGNVIFDHQRRAALDKTLEWLTQFGLRREPEDLHATTGWKAGGSSLNLKPSTLSLAGRYGQWKYYWTDDCVMRGAQMAGKLP
jgi:protoporphyrinogen oxidase